MQAIVKVLTILDELMDNIRELIVNLLSTDQQCN